MSVKHIDFLKIKPSKFLAVEIRPIRCLIDTPSGLTKTAKWMTHEHWKELRLLLVNIADEYEREKQMMLLTKEVKCNEHKMKDGKLIKIGYMFVPHSPCSCHYLTPKDDATWSDDEDDDDDDDQDLRDKGGKYKPLTPCGEMLVVSVRLQKYRKTSSLRGPTPLSPAAADKQLVKALDSSFVVTKTISDYFSSSQSQESDSLVPRSSSTDALKSDQHKTLKNMVEKSRTRQKRKRTELPDFDRGKGPNKNPGKKSMFDITSEDVDGSDETLINRSVETKSIKYFKRETVDSVSVDKEGLLDVNEKLEVSSVTEWIKTEEVSVTDEWMEKDKPEPEQLVLPNDYQTVYCEEALNNDALLNGECSDSETANITDQVAEGLCKRETEFVPCHSDKNEDIVLSYSPVREEFLEDFNGGEFEGECLSNYERSFSESFMEEENNSASVIVDEEIDQRSAEFGLKDNHCNFESQEEDNTLSQEILSGHDLAMSPLLGKRRLSHLQLSEASDSLTSSPSSQVTNSPANKNPRGGSDADEPKGSRLGLQEEASLSPSSDDFSVCSQPLPVYIPLEFLHNTSLSPVMKRVCSQTKVRNGLGKSNKKVIRTLFGENSESNAREAKTIKLEKTEPSDLEEKYVSKALGGLEEEYVPKPLGGIDEEYVPKALITGDLKMDTGDSSASYPCYNPSPIIKKEIIRGRTRSESLTSDTQTNSEDGASSQPDRNVGLTADTKGISAHRRSKRLQCKNPTAVLYNDEIMSPCENMRKSKGVVKQAKKDVERMKKKEILSDSQCSDRGNVFKKFSAELKENAAKTKSQTKGENLAKGSAGSSTKGLSSNTKCSKPVENSQEHDFECHKKGVRKNRMPKVTKDHKNAVKCRKKYVKDKTPSKSRPLGSAIHGQGRTSKCSLEKKIRKESRIVESKKTREARELLRIVEKEVEDGNKQMLEDSQDSNLIFEKTKGQAEGLKKTKDQAEGLKKTKDQAEGLKKTKDQAEGLKKTKDQAEGLKKTKDQAEGLKKTKGEAESLKKTKGQAEGLKKKYGQADYIKKKKGQAESLNKKIGLPKSVKTKKLPSNQLTLQECLMMKTMSTPSVNKGSHKDLKETPGIFAEKKEFKKPPNTPSISVKNKKCQEHRKRRKESPNKRRSKDMFDDSSLASDSSASVADYRRPVDTSGDCEWSNDNCLSSRSDFTDILYGNSQGDSDEELPPLYDSLPITATNSSQLNSSKSSIRDDTEDSLPLLPGTMPVLDDSQEDCDTVRPPLCDGPSRIIGIDTSQPESSHSSFRDDLGPLSPLPVTMPMLNDTQESSVLITEESYPVIEELQACRTKLRGVTLQEIEDRIVEAHNYLTAIMRGEVFNERHQIFKENGRLCETLYNTEVYGVFLEEQSEFIIDELKKKYLDKLFEAIKDKYRSSRYVWKVLAPSFLIKVSMDILNISNEIDVECKLTEICMKLDD